MAYSDMLVYLRKRVGLSQAELATRTGLTRSAISMYETGKRQPDLETFEILADFYNVDMNTLTGQADKFSFFPENKFAAQENSELTEMQQKALDIIKNMTDDQLKAFIAAAETFLR